MAHYHKLQRRYQIEFINCLFDALGIEQVKQASIEQAVRRRSKKGAVAGHMITPETLSAVVADKIRDHFSPENLAGRQKAICGAKEALKKAYQLVKSIENE